MEPGDQYTRTPGGRSGSRILMQNAPCKSSASGAVSVTAALFISGSRLPLTQPCSARHAAAAVQAFLATKRLCCSSMVSWWGLWLSQPSTCRLTGLLQDNADPGMGKHLISCTRNILRKALSMPCLPPTPLLGRHTLLTVCAVSPSPRPFAEVKSLFLGVKSCEVAQGIVSV